MRSLSHLFCVNYTLLLIAISEGSCKCPFGYDKDPNGDDYIQGNIL